MQAENPLASEFITFCHRRCQRRWPDIYDEMCWVAGRRLFRNMGYEELEKVGLGLCLGDIEKTIRMVNTVTSSDRDSLP
jgi:hypothetical protein